MKFARADSSGSRRGESTLNIVFTLLIDSPGPTAAAPEGGDSTLNIVFTLLIDSPGQAAAAPEGGDSTLNIVFTLLIDSVYRRQSSRRRKWSSFLEY